MYEAFKHNASSSSKLRKLAAKIKWHLGELFAKVGYILTNIPFALKRFSSFTVITAPPSSTSKKTKAASCGPVFPKRCFVAPNLNFSSCFGL